VVAVEALFFQASKTTGFGEFGIQDQRAAESDGSKITITGSKTSLAIGISEKQVRIGQRSFTDPATISLFQTLGRLMADLGAECKLQGVRGKRRNTRATLAITVIELSYGAVVVALHADSNGPTHPTRLYTLDVMHPKESFLWH
jgi:hypothetical protein